MDNRKPSTIDQLNSYYGKVPPQAIEIEMAVLGALMIESETFGKVNHLLTEESFYKFEHAKIFKAISELYRDNRPIDLLTVTQRLKNSGELDEVGGPLYITQLTSLIATAGHIEHHARIIQQKFIQRQLIRIGSELTSEAFDDSKDIEEIIDSLKVKIIDIDNFAIGQNTGHTNEFVLDQALKEIETDCEEKAAGRAPGITTGLADLNFMTGGWRKSNLIILASRPGIGKTSLALHFAITAAQAGKWVNFYGLEMSESDLMRIIISGQSDVNRINIRDGKLSGYEWEAINKSVPNFNRLPIIWNDYAGITASQIKALTAKHRKAGKCDLVIIDYIQLITPTDKKQNREQQISEISRTLKRTGLSEQIPILALAQLNREAEGCKPMLSHLRESGSLEQDADVVLMPWVQDNKYMISIAKNRRGKVGTFEINHSDEMTKFYDIGRQEFTPINYSESNPF